MSKKGASGGGAAASVDSFMSPPDMDLLAKFEAGEAVHEQVDRVSTSYVNNSKRFVVTQKMKLDSAKAQYSSLYFARLQLMSKQLRQRATERWCKSKGKKPKVTTSLLEVSPGQDCVIVGTLYKEMKLKPSILDEHHARAKYEVPPPERAKYHDEDDHLVLEDQTGRTTLSGEKAAEVVKTIVTGVVCAVRGKELESGEFEVLDFCFVSLGPQKSLAAAARPADDAGVYVVLVSGLNVHPELQQAVLPFQLFSDFVNGQLGSVTEQASARQVARVVVAGNLIGAPEEEAPDEDVWSAEVETKTIEAMAELDETLAHLSASCPVDIMPGSTDPANVSMPQQPLHHCMFPKAAATSSLTGVTNPYAFSADGVDFIGTSGQGVDDVYRYSEATDRLKIAQATLEWGHLMPSAPDTLVAFPFKMEDPFVLSGACPHVYFHGNQPEFAAEKITGPAGQVVQTICVPAFDKTSTVVMLNTKTLDCFPVTFNAAL